MPYDPNLTIVVACDDHYCIMLAVLLASIEANYKGAEAIDVYIVDDGISKKSRNRLSATLRQQTIQLHWIPMAETIPPGITLPVVPNSYPLNTYVRLLIPHFLPKHIRKVLFMDVDMLVLGDITALWATDIGQYPIAAVRDSITGTLGNVSAGGIPNHKALGLSPDSPYFNAGLQIINTELWRKQGLTEKIMQFIHDNARHASLGDQYGLNAVLADNWFPLPPLWNYMANGDHGSPMLIHFIHRKPFYKSYFNNPSYQRTFYEYLARTPWKGTAQVGESSRYVKKLTNMLQKARQLITRKGNVSTVPAA